MLLLDIGGLFPTSDRGKQLIAELSLKSMDLMGYTAMNLGWNDLSIGTDFFKKADARFSFPLITSNLIYKESQLPVGEKYLIRQVGDVKAAILGVMPANPSDTLPPPACSPADQKPAPRQPSALPDHLEIIPPEEAIQALLPEVCSQADLVILLSQCGYEATVSLVNQLEGIDLAISGQRRTQRRADEKLRAPVLEASHKGESIGWVKLTLDESGQVIQNQDQAIKLGSAIIPDTRVIKITGDDIEKKIRDEFEKMRRALLKLTPYEYYEKLVKEAGKGEKK